jgi:hypothetical protein
VLTGGGECDNRFNGFPSAEQTVETVQFPHRSSGTPLKSLKQGVDETSLPFPGLAGQQVPRQVSNTRTHSEMRPSRLTHELGTRHPLFFAAYFGEF